MSDFSDCSNLLLNRLIKNSKLYWYIESTLPISAITKYNIDPLTALARYLARLSLIVVAVFSDSFKRWLISFPTSLDSSNVLINISSSNIFSSAAANNCNILFSISFNCFLSLAILITKLSLSSSKSGLSSLIT